MTLIDRWILERLDQVIRDCRSAYEAFEFHKVYYTLNQFCAVDLSSLYIDITKDRMYCDAPDSPRRRATQMVMHEIFNEYSLQRARFAGELQNEAVALGESKPEDSSSAAGAMHRAWINLKSAIANHDDHAILAECERGEDSAVKEYKEAMEEENLAAPVREIISRQYAEVQNAHDRIKLFRDTMAT